MKAYFCIIKSDYIEGLLRVVAPNEKVARQRAVHQTLKDFFKSQHEQVGDNSYYTQFFLLYKAIKTAELLGDHYGIDKTWAITDGIFEELGLTCEILAVDDFNQREIDKLKLAHGEYMVDQMKKLLERENNG